MSTETLEAVYQRVNEKIWLLKNDAYKTNFYFRLSGIQSRIGLELNRRWKERLGW